jgi:uncharacterized repeat protein (TIGR03803 family)
MNNQNASRKRATRPRAVGWFTLFAVVGWLAASAHAGSVFTTLYTFTGTNDGANPNGLVQGSDGFLYGTSTDAGGSLQVYVARVKGELITNSYYGSGTVFKISTNGALSTLYVFGPVTNADHGPLDGAAPNAGLVQGSDGYFYGTTYAGGTSISLGTSGYGTVFKITTNGVLTSLYSFADANDGANPVAALVQGSDGNLYGTTEGDGTYTYNYGTVFEISTNGALTSLYSFDGYDGAIPRGSLVQGSDGNFYGTTWLGGTGFDVYSDNTAYGTVFKISTNGSLTSLHTFDYTGYGSTPSAGLALGSDGNFYGSTSGGFLEEPSLFKISANGVFTNLYSFTGSGRVIGPSAKLVQGGDGSLYGTTKSGGANNSGAVFKTNTNKIAPTTAINPPATERDSIFSPSRTRWQRDDHQRRGGHDGQHQAGGRGFQRPLVTGHAQGLPGKTVGQDPRPDPPPFLRLGQARWRGMRHLRRDLAPLDHQQADRRHKQTSNETLIGGRRAVDVLMGLRRHRVGFAAEDGAEAVAKSRQKTEADSRRQHPSLCVQMFARRQGQGHAGQNEAQAAACRPRAWCPATAIPARLRTARRNIE